MLSVRFQPNDIAHLPLLGLNRIIRLGDTIIANDYCRSTPNSQKKYLPMGYCYRTINNVWQCV